MGGGRPRRRGKVVLGRPDEAGAARFIASRPVIDGFLIGHEPWSAEGVVCVGRVVDAESHAAAIDALVRGADVVVDVVPDRLAEFLDDLTRVGATNDTAPPTRLPPAWRPLLDELASGCTVAEAARRCNVSVRTAHRLLGDARVELGVRSTVEAVATWSRRRHDPDRSSLP